VTLSIGTNPGNSALSGGLLTLTPVNGVATFTGGTAKGSWSLRAKGQNAESAGGTWTVTRK